LPEWWRHDGQPSSIVHRPSSIVMKRAFYVSLALLVLIEAVAPRFLYRDHAHFPFEDWPAFGAIYGLVACVAIVVVSKLLGKLWLMRRENYYER
jgi:hypothetical protein